MDDLSFDALLSAIASGNPWAMAAAALPFVGYGIRGYLSWRKTKRVVTAEATNKEEIFPNEPVNEKVTK
jgi:hypothetical protein